MGETTHAIDVNAPLRAVYNQWTQFEEFPLFMEGVEEVRQDGSKSLFWKDKIGGKDKQWEAEITEQVPDKRIAWESVDGTPNTGEVTFESLDFGRTRITLTMEYEPEGFLEKAGDALGITSGRIEGDLKRFQDFMEKRGKETGGWRGQIGEGESPDSTAKATRQKGAPSIEDATERTVRAQGREVSRENAVIEEVARGTVEFRETGLQLKAVSRPRNIAPDLNTNPHPFLPNGWREAHNSTATVRELPRLRTSKSHAEPTNFI